MGEGHGDSPVIDTDEREGRRLERSSNVDRMLKQKQVKGRGWGEIYKNKYVRKRQVVSGRGGAKIHEKKGCLEKERLSETTPRTQRRGCGRVKGIPGGTSWLQSCPSECADRVCCLRHQKEQVSHTQTEHTTLLRIK